MRRTLRRSCSACAKSKIRCDLRTPDCSRCVKRKLLCVYANEPLASNPVEPGETRSASVNTCEALGAPSTQFGSLDPFESYPQVRLPRERVQRLIHSFLHKIAFQYYPLDLSANSNPFLMSWWPLALGDPALFHVSLQTASLDEEFFSQKGFQMSELLMADSVSLLRRKVQEPSLAMQDGTMNSVITLATIEFGKGNTEVAEMHVAGVKRLVNMRGGIQSVMQTSPLTARMVSWVSMIIMGRPQFEAQNDDGTGDGVSAIREWQIEQGNAEDMPHLGSNIDLTILNVFMRLRSVFQRAKRIPLHPTRVHDLACFVLHRLLSNSGPMGEHLSIMSACVRYAIVLYMLHLQGPTYFTHASLLNMALAGLMAQLNRLETVPRVSGPLDLWLVAIGLAASQDTPFNSFFQNQARMLAETLYLDDWETVSQHIKSILWLEMPNREPLFRQCWDLALGRECATVIPESAVRTRSISEGPGFI